MFVDSQDNPQIAQPQPVNPMPHEPGPMKDEPKKEGPKEKEKSISIRPNFLLCALFQALNLAIIVALFVLIMSLIGIDVQKDLIDVMRQTFNELVVTSKDLGGVPMFGELLGQLKDTLVFAFLQFTILALILQIPVVNNHWKLFSDRLEYKKGFILLSTKTISFSDVKEVSFKKYMPLADFGKVTVEYSGGEGKTITMPYAFHAEKLTEELNSRIKQHQMSTVAAQPKDSQAAQPSAPPQTADVQQP